MLYLLSFISIYFISKYLSKYTMLGQYDFFWKLRDYFIVKAPEQSNKINQLFSNKLFFCQNCNAFWIGYSLYFSGALLTLLSSEIALIFAVLNYLMQVDQSIKEE